MRILFLLTLILAGCCSCPEPKNPTRVDDPPPAEAVAGDACHRAGVNLKTACPSLWRPDWDTFCRTMTADNIPLCPEKLAKVKSCAEADKVCR